MNAEMVAFWRARLDEDADSGDVAGRLQRSVEADRALLETAVQVWNNSCDPEDEHWVGIAPLMRSLVKHRVAVYSDHPDYSGKWKP